MKLLGIRRESKRTGEVSGRWNLGWHWNKGYIYEGSGKKLFFVRILDITGKNPGFYFMHPS